MIKVYIINDSFFVLEESWRDRLFSKGYGVINSDRLELSPYEVQYLKDKKKIGLYRTANKEITDPNYLFKKKHLKRYNYLVYKDLRDRGFRVNTGLKYGFPFRVYDKKEKHAIWLVEPIKETESFKIKDLVGKNRVANSTRKKMLIAVVDSDSSITYLEINWRKV